MAPAGDVNLPIMRINGEVMNGNERILKSFRALTGDDTAFLVVMDGKLYRLATLLKDKEGKSMNGVPLPPGVVLPKPYGQRSLTTLKTLLSERDARRARPSLAE